MSSKSISLEFVVDTLDDSEDSVIPARSWVVVVLLLLEIVSGVRVVKLEGVVTAASDLDSMELDGGRSVVTSISNLGIWVVIRSMSILVEPVIKGPVVVVLSEVVVAVDVVVVVDGVEVMVIVFVVDFRTILALVVSGIEISGMAKS